MGRQQQGHEEGWYPTTSGYLLGGRFGIPSEMPCVSKFQIGFLALISVAERFGSSSLEVHT